jgi:calcyclin binding protein
MGKDKNPEAGLMDLMKKMYEEGDENMKRTIAESWTKARDKNPGMGI